MVREFLSLWGNLVQVSYPAISLGSVHLKANVNSLSTTMGRLKNVYWSSKSVHLILWKNWTQECMGLGP